jgi:chemotaxis methyl-accepting protein methylase
MVWLRRLAHIFPEVSLTVLGTDVSKKSIRVARAGIYSQHSLQGLSEEWQHAYFEACEGSPLPVIHSISSKSVPDWLRREHKQKLSKQSRVDMLCESRGMAFVGRSWRLCDPLVKQGVSFLQQDACEQTPARTFDLILSRYSVCLYADADQKVRTLSGMVQKLRPGGFLIIGETDRLPLTFCQQHGLTPLGSHSDVIFQKATVEESLNSGGDSSDLRMQAATYSDYLSQIGLVPDWTLHEDQPWRDCTAKKMTEKSRTILAAAATQGRWSDGCGHLDRVKQDLEAREERRQERENKAKDPLSSPPRTPLGSIDSTTSQRPRTVPSNPEYLSGVDKAVKKPRKLVPLTSSQSEPDMAKRDVIGTNNFNMPASNDSWADTQIPFERKVFNTNSFNMPASKETCGFLDAKDALTSRWRMPTQPLTSKECQPARLSRLTC